MGGGEEERMGGGGERGWEEGEVEQRKRERLKCSMGRVVLIFHSLSP